MWKDIVWYEWLYKISNLWIVKNTKTWKKIKWCDNWQWYFVVGLYKNWISKTLRVHRLVIITFNGLNTNKPEVNHKNWIKADNRLSNLEWCTKSENQLHAYKLWLSSITKKHYNIWEYQKWKLWKFNNSAKKIYQICIETWDVIKGWYWWYEINRSLWINQANISQCCNWKRKTAWGYKWQFNI